MALREPGAASFHLHAVFVASAGEEFLEKGERSDIATGNGTYDEVWFGTHTWRREVKFGVYTATETDANGVRKFHATANYEPGRLMMLLDALYSPVPRIYLEKETHAGAGWKPEQVSAGTLSLVRLSKSIGSQRAEYSDSYYFLPQSGVLEMSNARGLVTVWSDDALFHGKVVPRSISIRAGERQLLTASISVESASESDRSGLDIPGSRADPGSTLRPFHPDDIRVPDLTSSFGFISSQVGPAPVFSMTGVLDRNGQYREVEVLIAPNPKNAAAIARHFRQTSQKPATIDGDACQFRVLWSLF